MQIAEQLLEASPAISRWPGAVSARWALPSGADARVAAAVAPGRTLPSGLRLRPRGTDIFHPADNAFPYGSTRQRRSRRRNRRGHPLRLPCRRCRPLINPLIVDGQYQGRRALGIGGALLEESCTTRTASPPTPISWTIAAGVDICRNAARAHAHADPAQPRRHEGRGEGGSSALRRPSRTRSPTRSPVRDRHYRTPVTPERVYELLVDAGVIAAD